MRYLSFIRANENQGVPPQSLIDAMGPFIDRSLKNGSLVQTGGLSRSPDGFRVRMSRGRITVTDGPFTESKEVIGGYALIEAPTRQAAIEATRAFMQLHLDHWPEWEGECEVRALEFLAP